MLNQLSKHQSDQDHNYRAHSELPLLVQQMSDMGLQIMPYMEIAARDILQRYGDDAFILADRILHHMIEDGDKWGIFVWDRIRSTLYTLATSDKYLN